MKIKAHDRDNLIALDEINFVGERKLDKVRFVLDKTVYPDFGKWLFKKDVPFILVFNGNHCILEIDICNIDLYKTY